MLKKVIASIRSYSLLLAWLTSVAGTAGALVAQYAFNMQPCMLCWYQRVCLFPLVVILAVATYREDRGVRLYTAPISIVGGAFAILHYLEQKVPAMANLTGCSIGVPCSGQYINWLGFITFPLLSLLAFVAITVLLLLPESGIEPPRPD